MYRARRLVALGLALGLVTAACGSDSNKSGAGSTPASPTTPSQTPANPTTPAAAGGAQAETAKAKEVVAPFLVTPKTINQTVPLTGKIPTDKPWVIITCELPQCTLIADGALAAAKAAGVPTKSLPYKTTDGATLTSAMKEALTYKPFAVTPIGYAQAQWDALQADYKAAGVIITSIAVGDTVPSDVVTEGSASQVDYGRGGELMANWVTADSGANAKILVQDIPAFAVLKAYGDGFKKGISASCSACKVTNLDLAPAQLAEGGVVPAIVSALQKDPSIKYLAATDGAFLVGIDSALKAASISGVKIVGGSPDINNLKGLLDGSQTAWTASAEDQYGWVALDIIARKLLGMNIPPADGGRVTMIATKENVGTPSESGLGAPSDFQDEYKKLWGLS